MILLTAAPGYATGRDEANDLIGEANALLTETRALEVQLQEQLGEVYAIDSLGGSAADRSTSSRSPLRSCSPAPSGLGHV